ncbi:MAG: RDD family protein [Chitinophagaceae bacterium]|jgi:uncharacterized RDD family membrane protein YckC|nr:RDD family protein [Chitinophagaceae bacterium]
MQTIKIQTSQNIELEYMLAGVGDRLVAYIIDLLIYIAYGIGITIVSDALGGFGGNNWIMLILALPILFYQLLCEVFLNGQSLGKKAKQIRVISLDGNQPNFGQYLIRWIFRIVDDMMGSGVVAIVTISLSQKAQRVGDMLAGTTVVRTQAQTAFRETLYADTDETYIPSYPQVNRLSDSDISLLREVVNRYRKDPSGTAPILQKAAEKIRTLLSVREAKEPASFLETVIKDYNHVTGKAVD